MTADFSLAIKEVRKQWGDIFKMLQAGCPVAPLPWRRRASAGVRLCITLETRELAQGHVGQEAASPGAEAMCPPEAPLWLLLPGGGLASPSQSGPLAGAADPVLFLLLVEAATLADAVLPIHRLALGVEEGERRAATYDEVLGKLLVLGEPGTLLTRSLAHLAVLSSVHIW